MRRAREVQRGIGVALVMAGTLALPSPAPPAAATAPGPLCAAYPGLPADDGPHAGMLWIEGGSFTMGDDDERPEERAAHEVTVDGFWIDRHEVTNAQFARFVAATGHVTVAERGLDPRDHPGVPPELLAPGAVVFTPPDGLLNLIDVAQWWRFVPGADWRHPAGPGSGVEGRGNHPVVNVAYEDAQAYARWLGRELPTEAQWELAARGGLDGATYSWGDEYYDPVAGWRANSWQGLFPMKNDATDGHAGTAPVGCFAANGYGLLDMVKARIRSIGNYSAHADQQELVAWVKERLQVRAGIFLTHGEDHARAVLRERLQAAGVAAPIHLPKLDEAFALEAAAAPARGRRVDLRVEDAQITRDWHNDYARLLLGLGRTLEQLPDDAARRELLRRMRSLLPT